MRQYNIQCEVIVVTLSLISLTAVHAAKHRVPKSQVIMRLYLEGQREAQRDLQSGKLIIKSYGLPAPWATDGDHILWRDYKIKIEHLGCICPGEGKDTGYNHVMEQAIEQRYGKGLLERIYRRAERGDYRPLPQVIRGKVAKKTGQALTEPKIIRVPAN